MNMMRKLAGLTLSCWLALAAVEALAQDVGDRLRETIVDQNGNVVNSPIDFDLTGVDFPPGVTVTVPALTVDFLEVTGQISDRVHFDAFTVTMLSDPDVPLNDRSGNINILPFLNAYEILDILEITASSDGNFGPSGGPSDVFTVRAGNGLHYAFSFEAFEPPNEQIPEGPVNFLIPAASYDVVEGDLEGSPGTISDWVDVSEITGFFMSSDNPDDYDPFLIVDGTLIEDPQFGGQLFYRLRFESDPFVVPEPGTIVLLAAAICAIGWTNTGRRTQRRYCRHE